MSNKKKLIPALRFPEFKEDGEWEEKKLGEIGDIVTGKTPNTKDKNLWAGEILFITPTDIDNNGKYQTTTLRKVVENPGVKELPIGTIVYTCIASIGKIAITTKRSISNQQINTIVPFEKYYNEFLYYSLVNITPLIKSMPATSTLPIINKTDFSLFTIRIPQKYPEQQKIADCLSSLDDLLAAHNEKLELLKGHKKGLMQNLFPQEGERVPKFRFPEFENDGEWEEKKLGEVGEFIGGGTPDRSKSEHWIGEIPWISSSDIEEDDIHSISTTRFINEVAIKKSATKKVPKGSILFVSRVGVGKLAVNEFELCTSQDFTSLIPTTISQYYIGYYFLGKKAMLQALNQGTSIKGFSKKDLEDLTIVSPTNPSEQQKIASCLSAVDDLIKAETEKIEALKEHKKGLMQGLFPKMEN